jgi:hypothetical protein
MSTTEGPDFPGHMIRSEGFDALRRWKCTGCDWTGTGHNAWAAGIAWQGYHEATVTNGEASTADDEDLTFHITVRVRAGSRTEYELQQALVQLPHSFPGYQGAEVSRAIRRDPAGSVHPSPLDTPQEI